MCLKFEISGVPSPDSFIFLHFNKNIPIFISLVVLGRKIW